MPHTVRRPLGSTSVGTCVQVAARRGAWRRCRGRRARPAPGVSPTARPTSSAGTPWSCAHRHRSISVVGQGEVELLLRLRQASRCRSSGGRARISCGHAEVLGQRVDLGLVEVGDGLEVGGAVALLHEEALVVLEPVRRPGDGVVEAVGVVVLEHLARSRCLKFVAATSCRYAAGGRRARCARRPPGRRR